MVGAVPREAPLGVGFLGAGPVTQAIHLPTLARLTDTFRVARVMDVSADIAEAVASRVGARWSTDVEDLMMDPKVEVVAICSPPQFHASQVIAACQAGKRAILCEKPFALTAEDAASIAQASAESGVPILVGAMHAYDPGWTAVLQHAGGVLDRTHTLRSSIVLPPNSRFEDFATEVEDRPTPSSTPNAGDLESAVATVSGGIMGLAIHDLPLIRDVLDRQSGWEGLEVVSARPLSPFGYHIVFRSGEVLIELHAIMTSNWEPDWRLSLMSDDGAAEVRFTPSYVHAGSGDATVFRPGSSTHYTASNYNGYEGEWRHLADVARGATSQIGLEVLIDDLRFALTLRDRASSWIRAATQADRSVGAGR